MKQDSVPAPVTEVIYQTVEEGAVLFLPSEELYFGLNPVGAEIWSLLRTAESFTGLCDSVMALYPGVERSVIEDDEHLTIAGQETHVWRTNSNNPGMTSLVNLAVQVVIEEIITHFRSTGKDRSIGIIGISTAAGYCRVSIRIMRHSH